MLSEISIEQAANRVAEKKISRLINIEKKTSLCFHSYIMLILEFNIRQVQQAVPEALVTAKQRLTTLVICLKRYTGEAEARRINRMSSTEPFKVYSQWQGNNTGTDPTRAEIEQY